MKIFLTTGTQVPMDRLVLAMDDMAATRPHLDVLAQIGDGQVPQHQRWVRSLDAAEYEAELRSADVLVGHAGMGTIIGALDHDLPLIMMPREAARGEHRNDHQQTTAARFGGMEGFHVARNTTDLAHAFDKVCRDLQHAESVARAPSPHTLAFTTAIRGFIEGAHA